ncbi:MAG TPA: hypothetical protein PKC29_01435 [Thermodesulfobacteriota bacterium]|nr:hypothetical protein [Thermodesulfobacteriota bacterium]
MSIAAVFAAAFFVSFLALPAESISQTAPAPAPAPGAPTPPDFPQYIVTPRDDLNPYDLSTMQKTTGIDYRKGEGTLGTTTQPSSNIEVNEALRKSREEREKAARKKAEEEAAAEKESGAEEGAEAGPSAPSEMAGPEGDDLSVPGVRGGLFTWTDENGVLHATNDLGQVPIEYQVEALENPENSND